MKITTLCVSLSILLIAFPALGEPVLTGTWCVFMSSAYSEGDPNPQDSPGFYEEMYPIEITAQITAAYGVLFYGQVDVGIEDTYFSGVLDGKTISMTHWDSVTRGELKKKGKKPLRIEFINNAFDESTRSGKTSIGEAVKGDCPVPE